MSMEEKLSKNGYVIVDLSEPHLLNLIQEIVLSNLSGTPTSLHENNLSNEERLALVKKTKDRIVESQIVKKILLANLETLRALMGPDIDVQSDLYLRVSRPHLESDVLDWHRDTFYGNSFWEMNIWFPIFPLDAGAGLMIIEGSHLEPAKNVNYIEDQDPFRRQVTKGSLADELGYAYAPKVDDTILQRDEKKIKLLNPQMGQAIIFFGHLVHRGFNTSLSTRFSIDLRVKNMHAPTNTKSAYYQPLTRGAVASWVDQITYATS